MRLSSFVSRLRQGATGQTMTEYALILAAVAIVVFVAYQTMGQSIGSLMKSIDTMLSTT